MVWCPIFFLLHQAQRIVKEYDKLLVRLDRIAQGDFEVDEQYQTSILPSLQEKLDTVQEDFEEAVKERVRSQKLTNRTDHQCIFMI